MTTIKLSEKNPVVLMFDGNVIEFFRDPYQLGHHRYGFYLAGVSLNGANATTTPMAINGFPGGANAQGGRAQGGGGPAGGPPAGGVPGGGFPSVGGDPGIIGGAGVASTTPQAVRQMPNQVPAPLLNALIELLQNKIK